MTGECFVSFPQSPNTLIGLYNAVIEHTAEVCASSSLSELSWPSPEFDTSASPHTGTFLQQSRNNSEQDLNLDSDQKYNNAGQN